MEKKVIELFAGVGGFRVGLNNVTFNKGKVKENGDFDFVWANQWEPGQKNQYAFECYKKRFQDSEGKLSNTDISLVNKSKDIPDFTLLTGGFPCQDYSVARKTHSTIGIEGKKGVLWWQINDIIKAKHPPFCLFENVNRLILSPSKQRGRDFGIMLRCLDDLGYGVEWRIINAADYGFPQRRRRIFIFAFKRGTKEYKKMIGIDPIDVILTKGVFAESFPIETQKQLIVPIDIRADFKSLIDVSDNFTCNFENSGFMIAGKIYTIKTKPVFEKPTPLSKIVYSTDDESFYISDIQKEKFTYLRGKKKIERTASTGLRYLYSEGSMSPFDSLDLPGRTMLTSEASVNRSTHIILDPKTKRLRFLTPIECERLNCFPDDWTNTGMPKKKRYFMMGNALVCGIVKRLGTNISKIIDKE